MRRSSTHTALSVKVNSKASRLNNSLPLTDCFELHLCYNAACIFNFHRFFHASCPFELGTPYAGLLHSSFLSSFPLCCPRYDLFLDSFIIKVKGLSICCSSYFCSFNDMLSGFADSVHVQIWCQFLKVRFCLAEHCLLGCTLSTNYEHNSA